MRSVMMNRGKFVKRWRKTLAVEIQLLMHHHLESVISILFIYLFIKQHYKIVLSFNVSLFTKEYFHFSEFLINPTKGLNSIHYLQYKHLKY